MSLGCGGAAATAPTCAVEPPAEHEERQSAIDELGRRAWDAMRAGRPDRLLFDDVALRAMLEPDAATRYAARRAMAEARIGDMHEVPDLLASAEYAGLCMQGVRVEQAGGVLGLRQSGWVADRALIIGRRPSGQRIAAWMEGTFVYSDTGFHALDLERVERPRWEHSDLEIAPCDIAIRRDQPETSVSGAVP